MQKETIDVKKRGFTLIELLVVIAIISLLASVVMANLNSSRAKGADALIKSDLKTIQTQANLYYDTNSSYGYESDVCSAGMFFNDPVMRNAIESAEAAAGTSSICSSIDGTNGYNSANATAWAVAVPLKTNPTPGYWCVDWTGASKQTTILTPTPLDQTSPLPQCP